MGQHADIIKEVYKGWGVTPIDFKEILNEGSKIENCVTSRFPAACTTPVCPQRPEGSVQTWKSSSAKHLSRLSVLPGTVVGAG